jgi:glycosyltransferase involved in cell wall biosynthesis
MNFESHPDLNIQTEITNQNWQNDVLPMVSIITNTYNHEGFIAAAIEGFLMQKTSFKVEILIHDDASTDKTTSIVRDFEKKYPSLIFPIYQTTNQYSQGIKITHKFQVSRAKGRYIALCEGDDYWTDPIKLQRQVDFLNLNHNYTAVAENGIWNDLIAKRERLFNEDGEHDVTVEELIIKRRFPTASVLFRKSAIEGFVKEVRVSYDTIMWCYLASKGKFRYLTNVSSVYNRGMQGVVLGTESLRWAKIIEKWNLELIRVFSDKYFDKNIAVNNIWLHYWRIFQKSFGLQNLYSSHLALFKCYKYNFRKTLFEHFVFVKEKSKYVIKSFLIRSRNKFQDKISSIMKKRYDHPPFYKRTKTSGVATTLRNPLLIVSLTSYPQRMKTIHFTLHTLLNQSIKPDKIVLWLAKEQFSRGEKDVPRKVRRLKKYGLSIEWCNDIRSYKKLIPSLKAYPNDIIVTADDDIYYPNNWLQLLYNSYLNNKNLVHCHRAHKIHLDANNSILPYKDWDRQTEDRASSFLIFLTGGGGVLYPPNTLNSAVVKDSLFLKLTPDADDIWFWAMAVLNETKIQVVENNISKIIVINETQESGLWRSVNISGENDTKFNNILSHFKNLKSLLQSEIKKQ